MGYRGGKMRLEAYQKCTYMEILLAKGNRLKRFETDTYTHIKQLATIVYVS
jgi:hypothetical protein